MITLILRPRGAVVWVAYDEPLAGEVIVGPMSWAEAMLRVNHAVTVVKVEAA